MTKPLIKICGLTNRESLDIVLRNQADLVGLIFAPSSQRCIDMVSAQKFAKAIHAKNKKVVAVFQDQTIQEVNDYAYKIKADFVQLHGEESTDYCQKIAFPIIKTVKLKPNQNIDYSNFQEYQPLVKFFLLDRPQQGRGDVLPNSVVVSLAKKFAIILAGGLHPYTIAETVQYTGKYVRGYDVASGVEERIGIKSEKLVKLFIDHIKKIKIEP